MSLVLCTALFSLAVVAQDQRPQTGPETEKRFPPLKVPAGFKATLFACDPLVEYPSAVALGPRPGSIFVAADYMTGLGVEIVRRDEVRFVEDTNGDGYADRAPIYAAGFNSIQGLTFHDGTVYVMHAPFLTLLRDTNGDGQADERRDLLSGLGLTPKENPVRLHCANGLVMGYDGWLYLALGDHGCAVTRPEGDQFILHGGGILRCRPDGRDLHVFAAGLRNIYDVALDDELNAFVRDNENDGGDYKIRVAHSFFGADHGYPYLYYERPHEALAPLADLGLGSSAGGLCYLEPAFPAEYRGNLFFCEWGRAVVRYRLERAGSSFAPVKEIEFAAGAENDPYGFKPTDVVVERDGSLIVVDWADGQRPKRGRARIYRIAYTGGSTQPAKTQSSANETAKADAKTGGLERWINQLGSDSYYQRIEAQAELERSGPAGKTAINEALRQDRLGVRARLHAVWVLARGGDRAAMENLFRMAQTEAAPRVRAQAVRALADLGDPVLTWHRLDAGRGDAEFAVRLAALVARDADARVRLEGFIALGRARWSGLPEWLRENLNAPDRALSHAAMQSLRRSANWPAILNLLDEPADRPLWEVALRALANQFRPGVVDGLIDRLGQEKDSNRRGEYAETLTRVHKKPSGWTYWGYRPAPRPPNTVAWEKTEAIEQALDRLLADPDHTVRLIALRGMQREKIPTQLGTLIPWLNDERQADSVAVILESLRQPPGPMARSALAGVVTGRDHALTNRLSALTHYTASLDAASEAGLLDVARSLEDGPVLAGTLKATAKRSLRQAAPLLVSKLESPEPRVRIAAIEGVAELQITEASDSVRRLLADYDGRVRQAAAAASGALRIQSTREPLLNLAQETDPALRRTCLDSLRLLKDVRVIPLALEALANRETQLAALRCISDLGGPAQLKAVVELAGRDPSAEVLPFVVRLLTQWSRELPSDRQSDLDRTIAELQGASGTLLRWRMAGPMSADAAGRLLEELTASQEKAAGAKDNAAVWQTLIGTGSDFRVSPGRGGDPGSVWLGVTDVQMPEPANVQFMASSRGPFQVWLNGKLICERAEAKALTPDSERFEAVFRTGANRVLVRMEPREAAEFQVRFRRKGLTAEQEQLTQAALSRSGNLERGRKLFFNVEKSACLKCHRLAGQGEQIGPELTGIGSRFSRIHIVESILEPSRTIASSFQTVEVVLKDGRELSGLVIADREGMLTLADTQGQKHVIAKSEIKEQRTQSLSIMPEGLEKALTTEEFIDLVAFLVSQKEMPERR